MIRVYKLMILTPEQEWYFFPARWKAENFFRKREAELIDGGVRVELIGSRIDLWDAENSPEGVCDLLNRLVAAAMLNHHD